MIANRCIRLSLHIQKFRNYLKTNFKKKEKIVVSICCITCPHPIRQTANTNENNTLNVQRG
jgi:hypothetical protein